MKHSLGQLPPSKVHCGLPARPPRLIGSGLATLRCLMASMEKLMAKLIAIMCPGVGTPSKYSWSMGQEMTYRELTGKLPWALDMDKDGLQVRPFIVRRPLLCRIEIGYSGAHK